MTPAPPEQVETTPGDAAEKMLFYKRQWHQESKRGERLQNEVFALTAKLSASEAEVARKDAALQRLSELTPGRANARTPYDLHLTVKAIADTALARQEPEGCERQTVAGPCSICGDMG